MAKRIDTNDDQMAMKNNIIKAFPGGIVSPAQTEALTAFDAKLVALIVDAKAVGVPQGLIVAVLHGHAHNETQIMIDRAAA